MKFLGLHIHHLDEGDLADEIVEILKSKLTSENWVIERPTEETNAIFVPVDVGDTDKKSYLISSQKFDRAVILLQQLTTETITAIRATGLSVQMRIHSDEGLLPIPASFVAACGRLNLGIYICRT